MLCLNIYYILRSVHYAFETTLAVAPGTRSSVVADRPCVHYVVENLVDTQGRSVIRNYTVE